MGMIYTFEIFNVAEEYSTDEVQEIYYDFDTALENAREELSYYKDDKDLIEAIIFEEEENTEGEVIGYPEEIYTISNLNQEETVRIRLANNYVCGEVDEYLGE